MLTEHISSSMYLCIEHIGQYRHVLVYVYSVCMYLLMHVCNVYMCTCIIVHVQMYFNWCTFSLIVQLYFICEYVSPEHVLAMCACFWDVHMCLTCGHVFVMLACL